MAEVLETDARPYLRRETGAWAADGNDRQRGEDWQMTVAAAHWQHESGYPQIVP